MLKELIGTELSKKELRFQPGGAPVSFGVTVVNHSDQVATFQVEVLAAGAEPGASSHWYRLSPEVSTKKPPGALTQFSIQVLDAPKPGFVGLMNLTVRVFSPELQQEDRQSLRLILDPSTAAIPLNVELHHKMLQLRPGDTAEIPVWLSNPGPLPVEAVLCCRGLNGAWFTEGNERRVRINPKAPVETTFFCQIPGLDQAPSGTYPFTIEVSQVNGPTSQAAGTIAILPVGSVQFSCTPTSQQLPQQYGWLLNWKANTATYQLLFKNQSNRVQTVQAQLKTADDPLQCELTIQPEQTDLPLQTTAQLALIVRKRRPWFGLSRKCMFQVKGQTADSLSDVQDDVQVVELRVLPVIPLWMQVLGGLGLLYLLWALSWLNPGNPLWAHHKAVYSVRFNGAGDKAVSGSEDNSMIQWRIDGFFNPLINQNAGKVATADKAFRVVRYRPVNNDMVAVGLENGEIQLWSTIPGRKKRIYSFFDQKSDRVLDLAFSPDSRSLFSGHGSGVVLQWHLPAIAEAQAPTIVRRLPVGFAVYALAVVGPTADRLAIAGQYNQLTLWDWTTQRSRALPYHPIGNAQNYIQSLATAEQKPYLMASGDNQGTIAIWNLRTCWTADSACQPVDEWTADSKAIHEVALTHNGCYLASAGEDGSVRLWALDTEGRRVPQDNRSSADSQGWVLRRSSQPINSVDITRRNNFVIVISGGENHQVRAERRRQVNSTCD